MSAFERYSIFTSPSIENNPVLIMLLFFFFSFLLPTLKKKFPSRVEGLFLLSEKYNVEQTVFLLKLTGFGFLEAVWGA